MDYFKKKRDSSQRTVAFIIAHPDDECMFFTPTILHYKRLEYNIKVLCLSTGDQAKLGQFRRVELVKSCNEMGIPARNVHIFDSPVMQDGMDKHWPTQDIADLLGDVVERYLIDEIITFDQWGVSRHPNHCDTYKGVELFLKTYQAARKKTLPTSHRKQVEQQHKTNNNNNNSGGSTVGQLKEIRGYKLETVGLLRKYIGIWDILVSKLFGAVDGETYHAKQIYSNESNQDNTSKTSLINNNNNNPTIMYTSTQLFPPSSYAPMKQHETQFVWFRYLFIFLSRYSFINTLTEIKST